MRTSNRNLVAVAMGLAVSFVAAAAPAGAQCLISGPTSVCPGSTIDLCAPTEPNGMYFWQGPNNDFYFGQCITVGAPGTYQLKVQDMFSGAWIDSCATTIAPGVVSANITGPTSTCSGTPVTWCGPSGSFEYAWSGPNGFAASTACVSVTAPGDYQLKVRPLPDGCWGDSTVQSLAAATCIATPQQNCPRMASWWSEQLEQDESGTFLSTNVLTQIASCVDAHDSFFSWASPLDGFRHAIVAHRRTLRVNAARQVATVWANVCAGTIGVNSANGQPVALDASTTISLPGVSGTVGDWLAYADAQLASLATQREHSMAVNAAYRRLIAVAWHINHGLGIGPACPQGDDLDAATRSRAGALSASAAVTGGVEPLSAELIDQSGGQLDFGDLTPNPFSSSTTLAFIVSTTTATPVTIGVYDVSGRLVRELVSGTYAPGRYETHWDGRANDGSSAHSGVYFILGRVAGAQVQTRVALVH